VSIVCSERIRSEAARVSHFKDAIAEFSAHNQGFWDDAKANFASDDRLFADEVARGDSPTSGT
jgi:hypothetical protein